MFKDWNFWFSVITGSIAITALILTFVQIRASNKQSLFDRRLECYLKIMGLVQLCEKHKNLFELDRREKPIFSVDIEFSYFINNTYLEEIYEAIKKPLEESGHKKFLIKREELKKLSIEVEFLFKDTVTTYAAGFIVAYEQLLFKMYQYKISLNHMHEDFVHFDVTLEQAWQNVKEPSHRQNLIEAYTNLKTAYSQIIQNNVMEKLKKQIKL